MTEKRLGVYSEDGMESVVEILKDSSDKEWERFSLKIVKVLSQSPTMRDVTEDEEFDVAAKRNFRMYCGWDLNEEPDTVKEALEHTTN